MTFVFPSRDHPRLVVISVPPLIVMFRVNDQAPIVLMSTEVILLKGVISWMLILPLGLLIIGSPTGAFPLLPLLTLPVIGRGHNTPLPPRLVLPLLMHLMTMIVGMLDPVDVIGSTILKDGANGVQPMRIATGKLGLSGTGLTLL